METHILVVGADSPLVKREGETITVKVHVERRYMGPKEAYLVEKMDTEFKLPEPDLKPSPLWNPVIRPPKITAFRID